MAFRMLSRLRISVGHTRALPCVRYRHSSAPKLHDMLKYWHRVQKGETPPASASQKTLDYWKKAKEGKSTPYRANLPADSSRSWTIQRGVMHAARQTFYATHRYCDTVFDKTNYRHTDIDFGNRLDCCEDERDFKTLENEIAAKVTEYSFMDLVYFMDGFLQYDYKPKHLLSVVCKQMAFNFDRENKTPSRVLHFLYIIGCSRNVPKELLGNIEKYIVAHIHEFTFTDFSVMAFAYMVTNQPVNNYTILKAMADMTLEYFGDMEKCTSTDFAQLSHMYKSFSLSKYHDLKFFTEMGDILVRLVSDKDLYVRTPQFMAIFRAYAAAGVKHDKLFESMKNLVNIANIYQDVGNGSGLTKSKGTRSKDMNRLIWAYGSLGVPVDIVWIETLLALLAEEDLLIRFPNAFVEGLIALTMFGVTPVHLYRKLYEPRTLRAIQAQINDERLDYYQLLLLHQYIKVVHPEFIKKNILEKTFLDRRQVHQKIERSLVLKKGLVHYWHSLLEILGDTQVTLKYMMQASSVVDLVIYLDENNAPIPQKNQYDEQTVEVFDHILGHLDDYIIEESHNSVISTVAATHSRTGEPLDWFSHMKPLPNNHILPKNPGKRRKICIRVLGLNQCFRNHPGILGHISVENIIIGKMGYEILMLGPKEANDIKCLDSEGRQQYVREHVLERLDINTERNWSSQKKETTRSDILDF